jgi:hypothetical protein
MPIDVPTNVKPLRKVDTLDQVGPREIVKRSVEYGTRKMVLNDQVVPEDTPGAESKTVGTGEMWTYHVVGSDDPAEDFIALGTVLGWDHMRKALNYGLSLYGKPTLGNGASGPSKEAVRKELKTDLEKMLKAFMTDPTNLPFTPERRAFLHDYSIAQAAGKKPEIDFINDHIKSLKTPDPQD